MNKPTRRQFIASSSLSLFGVSAFNGIAKGEVAFLPDQENKLYYRYPAIRDEESYGVVNAAHFDLAKVKELVTNRPELACASWDWGFGDYESAIGACSHTGRRDIAEFLMNKGARPDIFTFAMLGMLASVKEIIETFPGIQSNRGPHGITLLKHAQNRLASRDIGPLDKANVGKVIDYLEKLGNANVGATSLSLTTEDKTIFPGDYKFGDGETDLFNVGPYSLDPANFIRITRKGLPGRLLHKIGDNTFSPTGAPSVKIEFQITDGKAVSLTIVEHMLSIEAVKI